MIDWLKVQASPGASPGSQFVVRVRRRSLRLSRMDRGPRLEHMNGNHMKRHGKLGTLVLTRKKNEWIDINGGVEQGGFGIVITEIRGDKVRIGFLAPKDVTVHRREVTEAMAQQKGGAV